MMLCRAAWGELLGGDLDPRMPEKVTSSIQSAVIIDAKSVYDAFYKGDVVSSAYSMKEKYAGLELLAVSENLRKQNTSLLWVSSEAQLADSLTKSAAQDMMRQFLQGGQLWVVKYDPGFVAAKRKHKLPAPCQKCSLSLFLPYMSVCFRLIHMPHVHLKMARRHSAAFGPRDPFCHISFQLIWCYVISLLSHRPGIAGRDRHLTNREGGAKEVWSDTLLKAITCGNLVQVLFGVACQSTTAWAKNGS